MAFLEGELAAKLDLLRQVKDNLDNVGCHLAREVILVQRLRVRLSSLVGNES